MHCVTAFRPAVTRFVRFALLAIVVAPAAPAARAANIAGQGTGIIGLHTNPTDGTLGTPYAHFNAVGNLNDAAPNTSEDTWNSGGTETNSYVGIRFPSARTDQVRSVTLSSAVFFDGGWFGHNGMGPAAETPLTTDYLVAPIVQVTSDGGTTWVEAEATSNYVTQLEGTMLPRAFGPPTAARPATFTLVTPVTGINGIRLIGTEGGAASGGFIGVFDFAVDAVPEPTALGLLAIGGVLTLRRRRVA